MNSDFLATPPSHKRFEHHGMAERKPIRYHPIGSLEGCSRRLFTEQTYTPYQVSTDNQIRNLRF